MAARGPKSAASLSVATAVSTTNRLAPPRYLSPAQKAAWVSVVNARPADWFGDEHEAMLTQYCRHKVQSDIVADQLDKFDPGWMADEEGLKRFDKLGAMLERETRAINALLRSMRLTQQSLIRADKVGGQQKGRKPWQVEND